MAGNIEPHARGTAMSAAAGPGCSCGRTGSRMREVRRHDRTNGCEQLSAASLESRKSWSERSETCRRIARTPHPVYTRQLPQLFRRLSAMGCGSSTYQPDGPTDPPEEAADKGLARKASSLGDLRTSAYVSAKPRRSEVDYNRARTPCRTRARCGRPASAAQAADG
eukprot:scaffold48415_cov61-Phaeocystis_antarctica.AAC.3